jgi:hypothetical protein
VFFVSGSCCCFGDRNAAVDRALELLTAILVDRTQRSDTGTYRRAFYFWWPYQNRFGIVISVHVIFSSTPGPHPLPLHGVLPLLFLSRCRLLPGFPRRRGGRHPQRGIIRVGTLLAPFELHVPRCRCCFFC